MKDLFRIEFKDYERYFPRVTHGMNQFVSYAYAIINGLAFNKGELFLTYSGKIVSKHICFFKCAFREWCLSECVIIECLKCL